MQGDIPCHEYRKGTFLDKKLFDELVNSVREAGAIYRGQHVPARAFEFSAPDVKAIREQTGLSQAKFALLIGVSIDTLQNWEQGRRVPRGAAAALLKILQVDPEHAIKALHS